MHPTHSSPEGQRGQCLLQLHLVTGGEVAVVWQPDAWPPLLMRRHSCCPLPAAAPAGTAVGKESRCTPHTAAQGVDGQKQHS